MGAVLNGLQPCLSFLGKGERPIAVKIPDFYVAAGTDSIVEAYTAMTVYEFIDFLEIGWTVGCQRLFSLKQAQETQVRKSVIASDYPCWNPVTDAADVALLTVNGRIIDHKSDIIRKVEEAERRRLFGGSSWGCRCQLQRLIRRLEGLIHKSSTTHFGDDVPIS